MWEEPENTGQMVERGQRGYQDRLCFCKALKRDQANLHQQQLPLFSLC